MYEATFMIIISLFERALRQTYIHFITIPIVTVIAWVEFFSLIHYTLYLTFFLKGTVFFLNSYNLGVQYFYFSNFFELPQLINVEMLGI